MDANGLHLLQLALERKAIDEDGRLRRIPGPEPDDIPRVVVVRLHDRGPRIFIRDDVPGPVRGRLLALDPEWAYTDVDGVRTILAEHGPCAEWDEGRSYVWETTPQAPPDVVVLGPGDRELLLQGPDPAMADTVLRRPVYAVVAEGCVASAAVSVREDDDAAEVWVITDPRHRRRELAKQVVAAWAADVLAAGKTAFYSPLHEERGLRGGRPWPRAPTVDATGRLRVTPLDADGRAALARWFGDAPGSVIEVRALETGRCRAWAIGDPSEPRAAVVEWDELPGEFLGSGGPEGIWEIVRDTTGWTSILVADEDAPFLARLMQDGTGRSTRFLQDIGYLLERPAPDHPHPWVRLLTSEDLPLLERSPILVRSSEHARLLLDEGPLACAIVDGRVVSIANTAARTDRYGEVGVQTREGHREGDLATAAASLVCRELLRSGRTPRWSTGEHNLASRRVAEKLGFAEHGRETYVVPER